MPTLVWIILFTLAGGVLSALIASVFLLFGAVTRQRLLPHFVSFAIGALLGAALLGLIPHAMEEAGINAVHGIGLAVALGILLFFVLEKAVIWRHCHTTNCEAHTPEPAHNHEHPQNAVLGRFILVGDGIHNFFDGLLIGAAFLTDTHLGIVTALAVIAHEIPQEVGDVAVLLNSGLSRLKAFNWNMAVGFTTVLGGLAAYFALEQMRTVLPYVLAVAAGSFIYVAVADLIPGLHRRTEAAASVWQIIFITAGLVLILASHATLH